MAAVCDRGCKTMTIFGVGHVTKHQVIEYVSGYDGFKAALARDSLERAASSSHGVMAR